MSNLDSWSIALRAGEGFPISLSFDATGDGLFDLVLSGSFLIPAVGSKNRFRIIDGSNGSTVADFDDPTDAYSYVWQPFYLSDIDNDGYNEVLLSRRRIDNMKDFTLLVYQTQGSASAVKPQSQTFPVVPELNQNYPNPFNPSTTINFELAQTAHVTLSMFDLLGREVAVLVNEKRNAGIHEVKFDGTSFASGVYFYRIQAQDFTQAKRLLLLK